MATFYFAKIEYIRSVVVSKCIFAMAYILNADQI